MLINPIRFFFLQENTTNIDFFGCISIFIYLYVQIKILLWEAIQISRVKHL